MQTASEWIIDVTTETFERDVVEQSKQAPVVIDFWAPWCGPCRQLGPTLEQLAQEHAGKFILAKVNIDENQDLAAAFNVQSIPMVVAIRDAQAVNQFVGLLSETQIRQWLTTFLPSPADELMARGRQLEATDPAEAESLYRQALEIDSANVGAQIRLADIILAQNRDDESREIIDGLESRGYLEPDAERIKSQLELRTAAADAGDVDEVRRAAAESPDDLALKLKLAESLAAARTFEEALDICLEIIQRDKAGAGAEAKATALRIFDVLGAGSELASQYRRRLTTLLY